MVLPLRFSSFLLFFLSFFPFFPSFFCLSLPCPHPPFMNSFSPNPQQWFQPCLSSCPPPHPLVTANCAPFLDWHCFPRGRRTAVMIGGSNVLTIFLEHKHCHSVWKATLIEHRFVQAAYWMDFPCAWLVLQLILAIDWIWTIVITLANICFPRCHPPLDLETEDLAVHQHCRSSNREHQQSWTPAIVYRVQCWVIYPWDGMKGFSWARYLLQVSFTWRFFCCLHSTVGMWVMPGLGSGLLKGQERRRCPTKPSAPFPCLRLLRSDLWGSIVTSGSVGTSSQDVAVWVPCPSMNRPIQS